MKNNAKTYIISIAIALAVGGLSALLTMGNMDLYSEITKPALAPPSFLFPVVWTILYILMGISSYLVYDTIDYNKPCCLIIYAVSLFINFSYYLFAFCS